MTVGGVELNNSLSESTELDYDNIAYYWYEDGESIDLVCHQLDVGFLYIVYYDQYGKNSLFYGVVGQIGRLLVRTISQVLLEL